MPVKIGAAAPESSPAVRLEAEEGVASLSRRKGEIAREPPTWQAISGRLDEPWPKQGSGREATAAAPPSSVMNSRRFTARYLPVFFQDSTLQLRKGLLRCGISIKTTRVMNGPKARSPLSPFDSQLRKLIGAARRSHSCQSRPKAPQQKHRHLCAND
jgi:hypothetical protein